MGVMARWEREQIAKRTKEALAEKKKKGILGITRREVKAGVKRYWKEYKRKQKEFKKKHPKLKKKKIKKNTIQLSQVKQSDLKIIPTIKVMREKNNTFQEIADTLN